MLEFFAGIGITVVIGGGAKWLHQAYKYQRGVGIAAKSMLIHALQAKQSVAEIVCPECSDLALAMAKDRPLQETNLPPWIKYQDNVFLATSIYLALSLGSLLAQRRIDITILRDTCKRATGMCDSIVENGIAECGRALEFHEVKLPPVETEKQLELLGMLCSLKVGHFMYFQIVGKVPTEEQEPLVVKMGLIVVLAALETWKVMFLTLQ